MKLAVVGGGSTYTPELADAWREALAPGIAFFIKRHTGGQA